MKNGKRAKRRNQEQRMKSRVRRIMRRWAGGDLKGYLTPRNVGKNAATHCRPCGCWMCKEHANKVPRPRERAADYRETWEPH